MFTILLLALAYYFYRKSRLRDPYDEFIYLVLAASTLSSAVFFNIGFWLSYLKG